MMEIVNICIGGCGNRIGTSFWKQLMKEHSLDTTLGTTFNEKNLNDRDEEHLNVFLNERQDGSYVPRVVMTDLSSDAIETILSEEKLLNDLRENAVYGHCEGNTCYGTGYYSIGASLIDEIMDRIRKSVESCDCLEGFQLFHSIGGGAGSGLGSNIINGLLNEYPVSFIASACVLPSEDEELFEKRNDSVYNAVLSIIPLLDTQFISWVENPSLKNQFLNKNNVKMEDINELLAQSICDYTSPFRYSGNINSNYRKLATNLVPYPRRHFFSLSRSELTCREGEIKQTLDSLIRNLFNPDYHFLNFKSEQSKCVTSNICFRGAVSKIPIIEECVSNFGKMNESQFGFGIDQNIHTSICEKVSPQASCNSSATMISNTTAVSQILKRIKDKFENMFERRKLVSSYYEEGMDEMEFVEARNEWSDLMYEYEQYETLTDFADEDEEIENEE